MTRDEAKKLTDAFAQECRDYGWLDVSPTEEALIEALMKTTSVPDGMVLLPRKPTREMDFLMMKEDWSWEQLLDIAEGANKPPQKMTP